MSSLAALMTISDASYFCIVLEYLNLGSLQSFMRQFGNDVAERNVASFLKGILGGLAFLHEQDIIHRDIKAANVKLADFGVAVTTKKKEGEVAGSPYWMAPEINEMRGQLTPACDIWAVGAVAIELFTGHPLRILPRVRRRDRQARGICLHRAHLPATHGRYMRQLY